MKKEIKVIFDDELIQEAEIYALLEELIFNNRLDKIVKLRWKDVFK